MIPLLLLLCEDILRPPLLNEIRDNTEEILKRRAEDKPPGDCLLASDSLSTSTSFSWNHFIRYPLNYRTYRIEVQP